MLGDITIPDGATLSMNTLTCISIGGPATTVTWTRGSVTITEGTETVLNDPVTALYTHTLTVTERLGGLYTCTVANNKPSTASANINVQGIEMHFTVLSLCIMKYTMIIQMNSTQETMVTTSIATIV